MRADIQAILERSLNATVDGTVSRGIKAAEVDADGHLIFTLTDNSKVDLGNVTGDRGTTGERGPQGEQGAPGADGEDGYTPVRGVDYWTAADREEIVSDTLEGMPAWARQPGKPSYTASEITDGSSTVAAKIADQNTVMKGYRRIMKSITHLERLMDIIGQMLPAK